MTSSPQNIDSTIDDKELAFQEFLGTPEGAYAKHELCGDEDPLRALMDHTIARLCVPGTKYRDVDDTWQCPECGTGYGHEEECHDLDCLEARARQAQDEFEAGM